MVKQWRSVLEYEGDDGFAMERNLAADLGSRLQTLLQENRVTTLSSHKVFEGLEIAGMDRGGQPSTLAACSTGPVLLVQSSSWHHDVVPISRILLDPTMQS